MEPFQEKLPIRTIPYYVSNGSCHLWFFLFKVWGARCRSCKDGLPAQVIGPTLVARLLRSSWDEYVFAG